MKKGNTAKVIANTCSHFFEIGEEVRISEVILSRSGVYRAYSINNPDNTWRILDVDLEEIIKEEPTVIPMKRTERPKRKRIQRNEW